MSRLSRCAGRLARPYCWLFGHRFDSSMWCGDWHRVGCGRWRCGKEFACRGEAAIGQEEFDRRVANGRAIVNRAMARAKEADHAR